MNNSIIKKLAALAMCSLVSVSSIAATSTNVFAANTDEHYGEYLENESGTESISNLTYSGTYTSAINSNSYIYISEPATGNYSCFFNNVYMGMNNYETRSYLAFISIPNVNITPGRKIGTLTYADSLQNLNNCGTADIYYYHDLIEHNITIFINGIPYEKQLS